MADVIRLHDVKAAEHMTEREQRLEQISVESVSEAQQHEPDEERDG
jgi:hypothetical protein